MLHEGENTCSYGRHRSMLQNILILDINQDQDAPR
jgi:hypothetical protein